MKLLSTLPALSAKALILDLLRMVHPRAMPISLLIRAGEVLGINENAIRVNTTRLLTRAQVKTDERGFYQLGKIAEPFDAWLRQWQKGEARVKDWDGSWLLLSVSTQLKSKQEQNLKRFARHLGFREILPGSLIRPNNLQQDDSALCEQLAHLSGVEAFCLSEAREAPRSLMHVDDLHSLWDVSFLEKQYLEVIEELQKGIDEAGQLEVETAFKNSYQVGAEVHHRLALDPLLPKAFLDTALRRELIELFERYDAVYRPYWIQFFKGYELKQGRSLYSVFEKNAEQLY